MLLIFCSCTYLSHRFFFFFFNDTATTEIYTLSLHDALPISTTGTRSAPPISPRSRSRCCPAPTGEARASDRKSTRLNSSHVRISYAVFCLKKKKYPTPPAGSPTSSPENGGAQTSSSAPPLST